MAEKKRLTCTLCLEVFKKPKILPCFHTYCEECLRSLISHGRDRRQFLCPSCRKNIQVPPEGVSGFQINFWIDSEELDKARRKTVCTSHPENELVSVCITCDLAICVVCMLGDHKPHDIQTIAKAAVSCKKRLSGDKLRLQSCVIALLQRENGAKRNQELLKEKIEKVRLELQTRCSQLVSKAESHRDTELAKLESLAKELDTTAKDEKIIQNKREVCARLFKLRGQIRQTIDEGDNLAMVLLAQEIKNGENSQQALQALILEDDWPPTVLPTPALHAENVSDVISSAVTAVIGSITTTNTALLLTSEIAVSEIISCPRRNIYCLSVLADEDVCVSYEDDDAPVQRYNKNGSLVDTMTNVTGRVALCCSDGSECLYVTPRTDKRVIFAKSNRALLLEQGVSAHATVKRIEVKSKKTLITHWISLFTLECRGTLIAFDASEDKTRFAVLEQPRDLESNSSSRCLKVFQMPNSVPSYSFSFNSFQPTDVCFYKASGKEVLLVADETNNSIRALSVDEGSSFEMISLCQPTAMIRDSHGCLLIGCRDGRVFKSVH